MLTYAVEQLQEALPEVQELWDLHWRTTEGYRDELGFNPDVNAMLSLEAANMLRVLTARDENGRLMGHIGFILFKSRHTQTYGAGEDFFYFRPEARKGMEAVKFLRWALEYLKGLGVRQVLISSKASYGIDPVLKRVGFEPVATQYNLIFPEIEVN
jgi:predicted acetyltransferase